MNYFTSKNQLHGFCICGTLVENGLNTELLFNFHSIPKMLEQFRCLTIAFKEGSQLSPCRSFWKYSGITSVFILEKRIFKTFTTELSFGRTSSFSNKNTFSFVIDLLKRKGFAICNSYILLLKRGMYIKRTNTQTCTHTHIYICRYKFVHLHQKTLIIVFCNRF